MTPHFGLRLEVNRMSGCLCWNHTVPVDNTRTLPLMNNAFDTQH